MLIEGSRFRVTSMRMWSKRLGRPIEAINKDSFKKLLSFVKIKKILLRLMKIEFGIFKVKNCILTK